MTHKHLVDVPTADAIDRMDDESLESVVNILNECAFEAAKTLSERRYGLRKKIE